MSNLTIHIQRDKELRYSNSWSFSIQTMPSNSKLYDMEAISRQCCNRCNVTVMEEHVCFPLTFWRDRSIIKKGSSGKHRTTFSSNFHIWQTQPWFTQWLQMSIRSPLLIPPISNLLMDPQGNKHPQQKTEV